MTTDSKTTARPAARANRAERQQRVAKPKATATPAAEAPKTAPAAKAPKVVMTARCKRGLHAICDGVREYDKAACQCDCGHPERDNLLAQRDAAKAAKAEQKAKAASAQKSAKAPAESRAVARVRAALADGPHTMGELVQSTGLKTGDVAKALAALDAKASGRTRAYAVPTAA